MKKTLIIGGSPCAGKSTVALYLSEYLDCRVIKTDDYMDKHLEVSNPKKQPIMNKWKTEAWYKLFERPVDLQFKEEVLFYEEAWPFLKRDIYQELNHKMIIEGCALMPSLVSSLDENVDIVYMVPTEEFQREKYAERQWAYDILKDSENPEDAFNKWMERDIAFAKHIKNEAEDYGYIVIEIDGQKSVEEVADKIIKNLITK